MLGRLPPIDEDEPRAGRPGPALPGSGSTGIRPAAPLPGPGAHTQPAAFAVAEKRLESPERERQLLWLALHNAEQSAAILDEASGNLFNSPARRQLLMAMQHMFIAGNPVHPDGLLLRLESNAPAASLPALTRELGIILESRTELDGDSLLDVLDVHWRCRTVHQRIFTESLGRFNRNDDINAIIEDMAQVLLTIDPLHEQQTAIDETMAEVVDDAIHPKPNKMGLLLGLRAWDLLFGGIKRDRVITIGGSSGTGKTALIVDIIFRLLQKHADKVFIKFFSLETSNYRIAQRLLSRQAYVSVKRQEDWSQEGNEPLAELEVSRMQDALPIWHEWKNSFEVTYTTISARSIKSECKRCALRPENKGKHLVFILDHIGLVDMETDDKRKEFDRTMLACKDIARDLGATVIPLVQLTKAVESPDNEKNFYKPWGAAVMETGGVKAASDNLVLLWRPGAWDKFKTIPYGDEIDFDVSEALFAVIEKNRDGAAGNDLLFHADMEHNHIQNWRGIIPGSAYF